MYRPDLFRVDDLPQLHGLMRARPFAALVSSGPAGLFATHLPTVLKDDGPSGTIECHVARANPHWKELGDEVLMIFQGAEGYITPNWYPSKAEHGKVVPTWNYAVVHAYGRAEAIQDTTWLRRHVGELTAQQEAGVAKPWAVSDAPGWFPRGRAPRRRRPPPADRAARRQMEDEPEPRAQGSRRRYRRPRSTR